MIIGLIGKPSSGKSTFFRASTLAAAEIAEYPFTTIDSSTAVGYVRINCVDPEFRVQCRPKSGFCMEGQRFVPVKIIDVAGLIPGAHKGMGKGNQFLDDLREADVLIHVSDASGTTDEQGQQTSGHDPEKDVRFLEEELDMWYLGILKKPWERFAKQTYMEHNKLESALSNQFSAFNATPAVIKQTILELKQDSENPMKWSEDDLRNFAVQLRKATRLIITAANKCDTESSAANLRKMQKPGRMIVPCSAEAELALKEASRDGLIRYVPGNGDFEVPDPEKLTDKQKGALEFIRKSVLEKYGNTGVQDCVNKAVFGMLKRIAVFPVATSRLTDQNGNVLPDCLLMPPNSTALDLAYKLHTDFGKNFIKALDVRTKKAVGKDYVLKDRDVIEIICRK